MKLNAGILVLIALLASVGLRAQSEEDALRFSFTQEGGTGRSGAMGNAFGALGADPVSAWINPAGIGLCVASEFSLTPVFEVNDAASTWYNTAATGTSSRFSIGNFALMLHAPTDHKAGWRAVTFGLAYDRQASYHWDRQAVAEHAGSSILDAFVNEANGHSVAEIYSNFGFTSALAWDTYALDPLDTAAHTYQSLWPAGTDVRQVHTIESHGKMSNTALFFGANYEDRWYVGASLGIIGARYERVTTHSESSSDPALDLERINYSEDLTTTGNGVDLRVGIIARAGERLRLGAAFHSPMWLSMNDAYTTEMSTTFRTPDSNGVFSYSAASPDGTYAYRIHTPLSVVGSVAYVAGQNGAISVDYEWKDYRKARFRSSEEVVDGYDFEVENDLIQTSGAISHSVRVGTEWKAGPWRFRAGWGVWPDPYAKEDGRHGLPLTRYTGGLGWRNSRVSVDLAVQYDTRSSNYYPYDPDLVQPVKEDLTSYRTLLTVAWRP